jgi:hypothetical protein
MINKWIELNDIIAVAAAKTRGWDIEIDTTGTGYWKTWDSRTWTDYKRYRGRPKKQPRIIKMLAWLDGDCLSWRREGLPAPDGWLRVHDEDKIIEVTE